VPLGREEDVPRAEQVRGDDIGGGTAVVMGNRSGVHDRVAAAHRLERRSLVAEVAPGEEHGTSHAGAPTIAVDNIASTWSSS
jgi:hypothetical protein